MASERILAKSVMQFHELKEDEYFISAPCEGDDGRNGAYVFVKIRHEPPGEPWDALNPTSIRVQDGIRSHLPPGAPVWKVLI